MIGADEHPKPDALWYTGNTANGDELAVPVMVLETRRNYGRIQARISPVGGQGDCWVSLHKLERFQNERRLRDSIADRCVPGLKGGGGLTMESFRESTTTTVYTNAPPAYDYPQNVEAGNVPGCRVLDCPEETVQYQLGRYRSGLYWATTDIEEASYLRKNFPYKTEVA